MTAFVCTCQNIEGLKISYWTTAALLLPSFISITAVPRLPRRSGILTLNSITFNGGAFGQYGDRSHGHVLQLVDGAALAPPAVRSNPQEMAHLIGPLGSIENTPARTFVANLQAWDCV